MANILHVLLDHQSKVTDELQNVSHQTLSVVRSCRMLVIRLCLLHEHYWQIDMLVHTYNLPCWMNNIKLCWLWGSNECTSRDKEHLGWGFCSMNCIVSAMETVFSSCLVSRRLRVSNCNT